MKRLLVALLLAALAALLLLAATPWQGQTTAVAGAYSMGYEVGK